MANVVGAGVRVCFVCSGNICRSPTAEMVLRQLAARRGLDEFVVIDSAGTGAWHAGEDLDPRARRTLEHAGYDVPRHRARQFTVEDFADRDLVVVLDAGHRHALWWLATQISDVATATGADDVDAARDKLVLLRTFDPQWTPGEDADVPDPYYGGPDGFADVLATVERCCAGLLRSIEDATSADRPVGTVGLQQTGRPPL